MLWKVGGGSKQTFLVVVWCLSLVKWRRGDLDRVEVMLLGFYRAV